MYPFNTQSHNTTIWSLTSNQKDKQNHQQIIKISWGWFSLKIRLNSDYPKLINKDILLVIMQYYTCNSSTSKPAFINSTGSLTARDRSISIETITVGSTEEQCTCVPPPHTHILSQVWERFKWKAWESSVHNPQFGDLSGLIPHFSWEIYRRL